MQVGRFFSLQQGQVGQYLSSRVLVVRRPFMSGWGEVCYFGFDRFNAAQKFAQYLAARGYRFQLRRGQQLPQNYEIRLQGHSDLAKTLAYWDRLDQPQARSRSRKHRSTEPAIAA